MRGEPSPPTLGGDARGDTAPMLRLVGVWKVFVHPFNLARAYALRDMFRRRPASTRRGESFALKNITFDVRPQETLLVLGTRGSGKTTLARIICGVLAPERGAVQRAGPIERVGGGKLAMNPFLTAREYAHLALALHGVAPDARDAAAARLLSMTELEDRDRTRLVDLPKSAVRLLPLGASLLAPRAVYVFDGLPSLDSETAPGRTCSERIRALMREKTCLVFSSTVRRVPESIDRALVLHDGEVIYEGAPAVVLPAFEKFQRTTLRATRRAEGQADAAATLDPESLPAAQLVATIANRSSHVAVADRFDGTLKAVCAGEHPILFGPYLSDVAFELLYWLPLLRWVRETWGGPGRRFVAMSRGRIGSWYRDVAEDYVDVHDVLPADVFAARWDARVREVGSNKQTKLSELERELIDAVKVRTGSEHARVLEPALAYRMFMKVDSGELAESFLAERARHRLLPRGSIEGLPSGLSQPYAVVGYGFNALLPETDGHRDLLAAAVRDLGQHWPVVLVDWTPDGVDVDGLDVGQGVDVVRYEAGRDDGHLGRTAQVLSHASAYVGPFGGPNLIAPLYGVPTLALQSTDTHHLPLHIKTARRASLAGDQALDEETGSSTLTLLKTQSGVTDIVDRWLAGRTVPVGR